MLTFSVKPSIYKKIIVVFVFLISTQFNLAWLWDRRKGRGTSLERGRPTKFQHFWSVEVLVTNIFFEKCQNFKSCVNEIASTRKFLKRFDYFNFEILRFDHWADNKKIYDEASWSFLFFYDSQDNLHFNDVRNNRFPFLLHRVSEKKQSKTSCWLLVSV